MENWYIFLIGLLIILAIVDLIVGVSNDAVNFLNSAVGSKITTYRTILIVASIGILIGATFSSGMMEVARKGIFYPGEFYFSEIMIVFLAVMFTDVILLDRFNAYGMPTSTTVSIVFELLGAAVAISLFKIFNSETKNVTHLSDYINSSKAFAIISGILLSVVVAFICGTIVQYIARVIYTFNYKSQLKYFGAMGGAISITVIMYFILIKGAKGSSFIPPHFIAYLKENIVQIITYSFIGWSVLLQSLYWVFKINIPKMIVLLGTFALAMAFAGNDLVNFIGVPLASFESLNVYLESGLSPNELKMDFLATKIQTDTYLLLLAGGIMISALWFSKKSRRVLKTSLDLSRQNSVEERFEPFGISKILVRNAIQINNVVKRILPPIVKRKISDRFKRNQIVNINNSNTPAFDTIRASVNLVVASILISIATTMKLPLSTTYVTFMVAMGTSLADKAWGRESAVYRISGVLSVIGGWFFTAFAAFLVSGLVATTISLFGNVIIFILIIISAIVLYRSRILHKKRELSDIIEDKLSKGVLKKAQNVLTKSDNLISENIKKMGDVFSSILEGLIDEKLKFLKECKNEAKEIDKMTKKHRDNVFATVKEFQEEYFIETGHYYVQILDYLRGLGHNINYISQMVYEHVDNNHTKVTEDQINELTQLKNMMNALIKKAVNLIHTRSHEKELPNWIEKEEELLNTLSTFRKNQIKKIKSDKISTRVSILYLNILAENKNLLINMLNLLKSHRDFLKYALVNN